MVWKPTLLCGEKSERVCRIGVDLGTALEGRYVWTIENEKRVDFESVKLKEVIVEDLYRSVLFSLSALNLNFCYRCTDSYATRLSRLFKFSGSERVKLCPLTLTDFFS